MITDLLKECYSKDVELWTEDGKLRYRAPEGALTDELKNKLSGNKGALILRLEQNQHAKDTFWMTFEFGEMYNRRSGHNSNVCIFRNDDNTFTVWRGSWKDGNSSPMQQKTLVDKLGFVDAFDRANNYIDWMLNKPKSNRRPVERRGKGNAENAG